MELTLANLAAVIAGLLIGAGINTLADRVVGVDEPIWSATQCRKCGADLPKSSPLALIELARPRTCELCGRRASLRRPLIQLALATAFPLALTHAVINPGSVGLPIPALFALSAISLAALAFIFVVDLEHRLIYDLAVFPPLATILAIVIIFDLHALTGLLLAIVISGGLFLLFYLIGWIVYRQEALGFGDVKLAVLVGAIVGWPGITTTLMITAGAGFVVALLLLASGTAERRSFIPFGVFMAAAAAITLVTSPLPW